MKIFTLLLLIGMLLPSAIGFWWVDLEPRKQLSVDNHTLDSDSGHQSGGDHHSSDQQSSDARSPDDHFSHHQNGGDHMKGDEHHSHHHGGDHMKGDEHHSHHHGGDHMKGDEHHSHHHGSHHRHHHGGDHMKGDEHHSHHHGSHHSHHHGSHHMQGGDHHSHHHGSHHMQGGDHHRHHHGDHRKGGEHHSHHQSGDRNCSGHQHNHHHDGAAASGAAEPHTPALELVHNTTSDTLPCPMLYTRVGQRCLAFFTVARVPWSTAKEFCQSIFGDLVTFTDIHQYIEILEYLQTSGVDVDLWVGGRDGNNGWEWMDGTAMPRGTPYWVIRSAEGTYSRFYPSPSYSQAPHSFPASKYGQTGSCAAMMPKYFYYLSDEACRDLKSPVCVLREGAQVVIARGSEDTYPGIFIPTQDAHTIVWERAPPTTTAHTNTTTTQQVSSTPPTSTSSPISKSEDGFDGSGVQPSSSKHHTFDDSSEEEEDNEEEEEEEKEGEKDQKEGSGMMPDFLVDSETVHSIFMEI